MFPGLGRINSREELDKEKQRTQEQADTLQREGSSRLKMRSYSRGNGWYRVEQELREKRGGCQQKAGR